MPAREIEENVFFETLNWICEKLEFYKIPYMITGGAALGFWGHIRTTMDIDIVIQIYSDQIEIFLKDIAKEAYIDFEEARKALLDKKMFNIIHNETCFKIDIISLNEKNSYEIEKFENRKKIDFNSKELFVIGPEDLILSKLLWCKSCGESDKQLKDCESIYRMNFENIDLNYIKKWVKILNIENDFNKIY
jgi:hypothetical protein